jgi:hypothetical protein
MGPTTPVAAPSITAEYATALQPAAPNAAPVQSAFRFCRGAGGQTRVDSGNTSVISNPAAGQTILLDHVKKTATIQQAPPPPPGLPAMPKPPALPGAPAIPKAPNVQVQDLGKSVIQGQAVEGKRFLIPPPPPLPAPPAMPKPPALPAMPQAPKAPGAPAAPPVPKPPTIADFWHSPALCLPMLTKMSGPFGQMTQACHSAVPGEPHPAAFQIPPGYKVILAPPPKPPTAPPL